jgi:hypothetical protein
MNHRDSIQVSVEETGMLAKPQDLPFTALAIIPEAISPQGFVSD